MRIGYVRLFVTDLAAAKKFYAQILGLEILWEYENKAIGFDLGPVLIVEDVSSEEDLNERHLAGRFVGCSIEVEDIQATYSELVAKGVHFAAPPEKQEWAGTARAFRGHGRKCFDLGWTKVSLGDLLDAHLSRPDVDNI